MNEKIKYINKGQVRAHKEVILAYITDQMLNWLKVYWKHIRIARNKFKVAWRAIVVMYRIHEIFLESWVVKPVSKTLLKYSFKYKLFQWNSHPGWVLLLIEASCKHLRNLSSKSDLITTNNQNSNQPTAKSKPNKPEQKPW